MRTKQNEQRTLLALPCACANLRRAARAVTHLYDGELRATGLRVTQFTLLQVLARAGPIRQGVLGEALALDSTTLTRTLALLSREGWIRSMRGADQRERYFELAPSGRRVLAGALPHWERAQRRLRTQLGEAVWARLEKELMELAGTAWQA